MTIGDAGRRTGSGIGLKPIQELTNFSTHSGRCFTCRSFLRRIARKFTVTLNLKRKDKVKKWAWGFRPDFRLWYDHVFYDGDIYCLNLGWFYACYKPWGW